MLEVCLITTGSYRTFRTLIGWADWFWRTAATSKLPNQKLYWLSWKAGKCFNKHLCDS